MAHHKEGWSPFFEREWPSRDLALSNGKIDEVLLRQIWVKALLHDIAVGQTVWISVDASSIPRPEAETSEDRGIIHVSNLPRATKPISVGWQCSTVMLLPEVTSSWVGILDQQRIETAQTAIGVAIAQLQALVPLINHPIIIVADRWYATADFLRACRELGCQVLIRLKRNRKLYRPPVRTSPKGRRPLDGPLFQGSRPDTVTESQIEQYKEEVKAKWGSTDAYKQSIDRTRRWTKEDAERIKEEWRAITLSLAKLMEKGVAHAEVQAQIERHFQHINQFYDCSYEMYRNLGNMYSEDTRFAENYNTVAPHLAEFMRDAIAYYCSAHEKVTKPPLVN